MTSNDHSCGPVRRAYDISHQHHHSPLHIHFMSVRSASQRTGTALSGDAYVPAQLILSSRQKNTRGTPCEQSKKRKRQESAHKVCMRTSMRTIVLRSEAHACAPPPKRARRRYPVLRSPGAHQGLHVMISVSPPGTRNVIVVCTRTARAPPRRPRARLHSN